jgi:hypothetical protein
VAAEGAEMNAAVDQIGSHFWHRNRLAEDISEEPQFIGDHAFHMNAELNWADLERIGHDVLEQFPEVIFFPAIYIDRDQRRAPSSEAVAPIYKNIVDCARDPTHVYHVPRIAVRWPWADEFGSDNPDVLAGRILGARSPWLDPPGSLATNWSRSRRIGRVVTIETRFKGYLKFQDIEIWNGKPYWATRELQDGRRLSDLLPDSWCFHQSSAATLEGGYQKSSPDKAYFCEAIKRIWRRNSTDIYATYDGLTGEVFEEKMKSYESRFGFNALKHGIDGTRRFISIGYHRNVDRFSVVGPRKAHIKKALATPDSALDLE